MIQHIAGGEVFFTGCVLTITALSIARRSPVGQTWARRLLVLALLSVFISATPLPHWLYAIWIPWLILAIFQRFPRAADPGTTARSAPSSQGNLFSPRHANSVAWCVTLLAIFWELPYHFHPRLDRQPERLIVLGDSISAGLDETDALTWPRLLQEQTQLEIHNLSRAGATLGSINRELDQKPTEIQHPGLVIVELGGNDLLGGTDVATYARDLDQLLARLTSGHEVIMFELPLPPTFNRYGQVQRALAAHHGVQLIPKSTFVRLLISSDTTLDSIHLNPAGNQRFADVVKRLLLM